MPASTPSTASPNRCLDLLKASKKRSSLACLPKTRRIRRKIMYPMVTYQLNNTDFSCECPPHVQVSSPQMPIPVPPLRVSQSTNVSAVNYCHLNQILPKHIPTSRTTQCSSDAIRSRKVYSARVEHGCTEQLVLVNSLRTMVSYGIALFSVRDNSRYELPSMSGG